MKLLLSSNCFHESRAKLQNSSGCFIGRTWPIILLLLVHFYSPELKEYRLFRNLSADVTVKKTMKTLTWQHLIVEIYSGKVTAVSSYFLRKFAKGGEFLRYNAYCTI